jgi:hypothetical protein
MGWHTTVDLDQFAATACGYLASRAAENTLLLSAVLAARAAQVTRATAQEPGGGWLFGWWEPPGGGEPRGAFLHDPMAPLLVSSLVPEMAASLAATLAKMNRPVLGVDAPTEAADAFAAAWSQRAGTVVRVHRHCHVYRIAGPGVGPGVEPGAGPGGAPVPPSQPARALPGAHAWPPPQPPVPPGRLRIATDSDKQLLADWLTAFANETAERMDSPLDVAADLISYGGAVFWEAPKRPGRPWDPAHFRPAALATLTRPTAGVVRISMLYTPPDCRHCGYASAVTMAVSRAVLSGPVSPGPGLPGTAPGGDRVDEVVMITDRNRPDSWAIRLGYQLVNERTVLRFGPVAGALPRAARTGPMPRLPTGPLPRLPRLRG